MSADIVGIVAVVCLFVGSLVFRIVVLRLLHWHDEPEKKSSGVPPTSRRERRDSSGHPMPTVIIPLTSLKGKEIANDLFPIAKDEIRTPNQLVNGQVNPRNSSPAAEYKFGDARAESRAILGDAEFVEYSFATLKAATRNFSDENKLGQGGFGTVYKGILDNGEQLAIKRLSGTSGQGTKEFMAEARLLAKLQHRNLAKLVGFCSEGNEKLLVYEFMSNASLDGFLFDPIKRSRLDWGTRYKMIMGIARGLQYLHEDSRLTIVHRDLKPGNILLDKEMNSKIADFGLARLFEGTQKFGNTSRIAGTLGYMAPEYMATGEYSEKSDVYSFGIMVLEIVSGQNNKTFYQWSQHKADLSLHVWRLWNEDRSLEITDPALYNNCPRNDVERCLQIGLLCLQANFVQRPTMTLVVSMLTGSVELPIPSAPAMSFPQFNMHMGYTNEQQSDIDQSSTISVSKDTHPIPNTPF